MKERDSFFTLQLIHAHGETKKHMCVCGGGGGTIRANFPDALPLMDVRATYSRAHALGKTPSHAAAGDACLSWTARHTRNCRHTLQFHSRTPFFAVAFPHYTRNNNHSVVFCCCCCCSSSCCCYTSEMWSGTNSSKNRERRRRERKSNKRKRHATATSLRTPTHTPVHTSTPFKLNKTSTSTSTSPFSEQNKTQRWEHTK
jgi:hypothetical protein